MEYIFVGRAVGVSLIEMGIHKPGGHRKFFCVVGTAPGLPLLLSHDNNRRPPPSPELFPASPPPAAIPPISYPEFIPPHPLRSLATCVIHLRSRHLLKWSQYKI